jgi:hypothetical protein
MPVRFVAPSPCDFLLMWLSAVAVSFILAANGGRRRTTSSCRNCSLVLEIHRETEGTVLIYTLICMYDQVGVMWMGSLSLLP